MLKDFNKNAMLIEYLSSRKLEITNDQQYNTDYISYSISTNYNTMYKNVGFTLNELKRDAYKSDWAQEKRTKRRFVRIIRIIS